MIAELSDHAVDHIGLVAFAIVLVLSVAVCMLYWIKREYDDKKARRR